jgi:fluoroacetyl-CoA thioesterase
VRLDPGLEGKAEGAVEAGLTAESLGSGDLPVLGTPAVLAMVERAAVDALADRIGRDQTSVGSTVELHHVAPTPIGVGVRAFARLTGVDGRKLEFEFEVTDAAGTVARGRHGRVIVDRERFLEEARKRS